MFKKFCKGLIAVSMMIGAPYAPASAQSDSATIPVEPGKQCVYNKGGYILKVDWYDPADIVWNGKDDTFFENYKMTAKPVSEEKVSLGYSSCTDASNRWAVVRIQDYDKVNSGLSIGVGVLSGVASVVAGAFVCVGTAGAGCPAVAGAVPLLVGGAIEGAMTALPDVKEIVYIGKPSSKNYLDFYGTVWEVGMSSEIALTEKRKPIAEAVTVVSDWIEGGKPSSKSITFNNQAGYVAEMVVLYHKEQDINGVKVPMPVVKSTGDLSLGFSRHLDIPTNIPNMPITVMIKGVGTFENDVYTTTIPADFTGNKCYKSWGTIFDTEGGSC